jgi:hypothetical protein
LPLFSTGEYRNKNHQGDHAQMSHTSPPVI